LGPFGLVGIPNPSFLLVSFQAYQFKYDSIHGRFNGLVEVEGDNLIIDGQVTYRLSKERRTGEQPNIGLVLPNIVLPWRKVYPWKEIP
jgi:glyceraldehyde-3-phosphate dehydrogenase/erythrose-4-phosphate dehydrogenase